MADPYVVAVLEDGERVLFLGDDSSGRALEVVAIQQEHQWLVIHVMDLRKKFRFEYERGKSDGQR